MELMGALYYLGPPIFFILFCMVAVRLTGPKQRQLGWITQTSRRWLVAWSILGFAIAVALVIVALITNNSYVFNHAQWVWPLCMGLVAFDPRPPLRVIVLLLPVMGFANAIVYFLLAALIQIIFGLIAKVRNQHKAMSISER